MKPLSFNLSFVLLLAGVFNFVYAAKQSASTPIFTSTPYIVVTPKNLTPAIDSVLLQVMVGTASNSCMAPTFGGCTFKIEKSPLTIYPPLFTVTVRFVQIPIPADRMCGMNYDPVDYGPRYMLGQLRVGNYRVIDGNPSTDTATQRVYGEFQILEAFIPSTCTINGRVHDDPLPLERMNMPVVGAKIYLRNSGPIPFATGLNVERLITDTIVDSTVTDNSGNYVFKNVTPGPYVLACSHADYRGVTVAASVRIDTAINFTLVSVSASATVTGLVTLTGGSVDSRRAPMEGCTVTVSRPPVPGLMTPEFQLRAITDNNGRYTVAGIPIYANGAKWNIRASRGVLSEVKQLPLYNMRTDTANFPFVGLYENSDSAVAGYTVLKIATNKAVYAENEAIKIRYSITNNSRSTMTFGPFSKGCEYDLVVSYKGILGSAVYRASDQPLCLDTLVNIVVDPGETVVHDFPALYLSDLKWISSDLPIAPQFIAVNVGARLQGKKFDTTLVDVPVSIELYTTAVQAAQRGSGSPTAAFNPRTGKLSLNLDKEQNVSVACYTLGGAIVGKTATTQHFPAGMHTLSVRNVPISSNMYIVNVQGKNFTRRFTSVGVGR